MTILVAQSDQQTAVIPAWVVDLQSFRRWAFSDEFPESGRYSHLDGNLWIDTNMEKPSHNQLKKNVCSVLTTLSEESDSGIVFTDGMLLSHVAAGVSTEPDGMFVSHDTLSAGRVVLEKGRDSVEVLGTPDMVLEVVSPFSKQKDRVVLPELYHRANIREYWIVEPVADHIKFELLVWQPGGFVPAPESDGWRQSLVLGKSFRIAVSKDRSDLPVYRLESRT